MAAAALGACLVATPTSASEAEAHELRNELREALSKRGLEAYVQVLDVHDHEVHATIHVVGAAGRRGRRGAEELLEWLHEEVLEPHDAESDFAPGTQLILLGRDGLTGFDPAPTVRADLARLSREIIRETTDHGFAIRHLHVRNVFGPETSVDLKVRGVDMGAELPAREAALGRALRWNVFERLFPFRVFPESEFRFQVEAVKTKPQRGGHAGHRHGGRGHGRHDHAGHDRHDHDGHDGHDHDDHDGHDHDDHDDHDGHDHDHAGRPPPKVDEHDAEETWDAF